MRKLATIRIIQEKRPIPNADVIEHVRVDGWWVVCKKDEFQVGDEALYIEIDSWVPHHVAPFLSKGQEPKVYNGIPGERLRTIKLRGVLSQGLLISPATLPHFSQISLYPDTDYSDVLGITKWEPPVTKCQYFAPKGSFPSFIRKTDQERVQNVLHVFEDLSEKKYEVTLKLDGSSMTVFYANDRLGICSRNLEVDILEDTNQYVQAALNHDLLNKLQKFCSESGAELAIQGELMGPKIQGNPEKFIDYEFFCFDIWDIKNQSYVSPVIRRAICNEIGIKHVPVLHKRISLKELGWINLDITMHNVSALTVEGYSTPIEGVVFKNIFDSGDSFKVINNEFLLRKN